MNFNVTKYRDMLRKAIGDRTQKDFANIAGISPFNLNRMLNGDENELSVPRRSTLMKIADASEGRVTAVQLLNACGYETHTEPIKPLDLTSEEQNLNIAMRFKEGLEKTSGIAMKYASIEEFLDTVILTYGISAMRSLVWEKPEFSGSGYKGAENLAHCSLIWKNLKYDSRLEFTLFFCNTMGGGVIVSDVVFDLSSLISLHHNMAGRFLFAVAEKGDVNYADYPLVFTCKAHVPGEAERRLLEAIFGENYNK